MIETLEILNDGLKLPVMEEFYTLQGEGYNMGKAAYFVRVGGCDVGCSWCDSKESWNEKLFPPVDIGKIVENARKAGAKTVVVTGGEPSLYPLELFTTKLKSTGISTMVETSGAHELTGVWDWICLSPKKYSPPKSSIYSKVHELKVIIKNEADIKWAELNAELVNKSTHLFLQPEWSNIPEIMPIITDYIMKTPKWRISLQSHKYMGIP
jgi:7-carboxy-7-deazaguanine synthase